MTKRTSKLRVQQGLPSPPPLTDEERERIIRSIIAECRSANDHGPDVNWLVELVEHAIDPNSHIMPTVIRDDDNEEDNERRKISDALHNKLKVIRIKAIEIDNIIKGSGGIADFNIVASAHPLGLVILELFGQGGLHSDWRNPNSRLRPQDLAIRIIDAIDTLAMMPDLRPPSARGKKREITTAGMLVKAVCFYLSECGIEVQYNWGRVAGDKKSGKRGGATAKLADEDLPPGNRTAALIAATARSFGLSESHSELITHLKNFGRALYRGSPTAERRQPSAWDLE